MLIFLVHSYLQICELHGVSACDCLIPSDNQRSNRHRSNQWMFMLSAIYQQAAICSSVQLYPCDTCDRRYRRIISLQRHKRLECGKEAKFGCMICHAKFKHKHSLLRHYNVHVFDIKNSFVDENSAWQAKRERIARKQPRDSRNFRTTGQSRVENAAEI